MNPCRLSHDLEELCCRFFELERKKRIWKALETSFTDVLIASFAQNLSNYGLSGFRLEVDASNERTTGADIEILVRDCKGSTLNFVVQAKRARANKARQSHSYNQLFHSISIPAGGANYQVTQLVNYCKSSRIASLPLYAMYHSESASKDLTSILKKKVGGIMLVSAHEIETASRVKPHVLKCDPYLENSIPFHAIFCSGLSAKFKIGDLINSVFSDWSDFLDDEFFKKLNDKPYSITDNDIDAWLGFERDFGDDGASSARMFLDFSGLGSDSAQ